MFAKYPDIPKRDIKRILQFGWKSWYLHNSYGGDVLVASPSLWFYSGRLMKDSLKWFQYYKRKMKIKLRVIYKRKKIEWDGYYYFALTTKQYQAYLDAQHTGRGRPKKNFIFNHVFMYKIFDECSVLESSCVAIFRIPSTWDRGFCFYTPKLKTGEAELILTRNPLKFKEILLSEYDYQFISELQPKKK